jgi:hypothetical protein
LRFLVADAALNTDFTFAAHSNKSLRQAPDQQASAVGKVCSVWGFIDSISLLTCRTLFSAHDHRQP